MNQEKPTGKLHTALNAMVTQRRGTINNKTFHRKVFPGKILGRIKFGFDLKKEGRKIKESMKKAKGYSDRYANQV